MVCGEHDGNGHYEVLQLCKATKRYIINDITESKKYFNSKSWYVHSSELPLLFKKAKDTGNHPILDYSRLPRDIQNNIDSVLNKTKKILPQSQDDFSVLHLTKTAPEGIIDVVYKALIKIHHPDVGGDQALFIKIKDAYERIRSYKSSQR